METKNVIGGAPPHRVTALDPTSTEGVKEAVHDVASSVEELYRVANDYVGRRAEDRPYVVLGAAFGIGFVLGGGLASRLGGVVATLGSKLLVSRLFESQLPGFYEPE
jgi:hypothetical protein